MIEQFKEWYENRHEYAKDWKKSKGGKVMGCFCTYEPEEILYAADILPVRVYGSHEPQSVTEPHIFGMFCPWTRDVLAQGLQGRYDYLDGITLSQSCLHFRQAFSSWQKHVPVDYSYYLPMPHGIQSPRTYPFYTQELVEFKKSLEEWTGKTITDEDLDGGIEIMNQSSRLMRKIWELRRSDNPPLTGLEALYIVASGQMTDKREHNRAMEELLKELSQRKLEREPGKRLMIIGSENDDVEFMEMVESSGATFVVDENCVGTRYFWGEVQGNGQQPRLEAIAARYIDRPPCPAKDWPKLTRLPHILNFIEEYNVQGVILMQQKFCDPHELDLPAIRERLKEKDIPSLFLEFDVTVPVGQFKTRVEAFLEMLGDEDLFFEDAL